MPQRNSRQPKRHNKRNNAVVQELKSVNEKLTSQQTYMIPVTKDIIFPRVKRNKVWSIEASYTLTLTSAAGEVDGVIAPTLATFAQSSNWAAVFDTFRIGAVRVAFVPRFSTIGQPIFTVLDYDDLTGSTPISTLVSYDTLLVSDNSVYFERSFIPRVLVDVNVNTSDSLAFAPTPKKWIDTAGNGPNLPWLGLKYGYGAGANASTTVIVTAMLQFKNSI